MQLQMLQPLQHPCSACRLSGSVATCLCLFVSDESRQTSLPSRNLEGPGVINAPHTGRLESAQAQQQASQLSLAEQRSQQSSEVHSLQQQLSKLLQVGQPGSHHPCL